MSTAAMTCCAIDVSAIQILVEVKSTGRIRFARFQSSGSSCQTSRSFTMDEDAADFLRLSFMLWARVDTSGRFSLLFFLQVRGMMQLLCNPSSSIELFSFAKVTWSHFGLATRRQGRWWDSDGPTRLQENTGFCFIVLRRIKNVPGGWPVCAKSEIDNPHDQNVFFLACKFGKNSIESPFLAQDCFLLDRWPPIHDVEDPLERVFHSIPHCRQSAVQSFSLRCFDQFNFSVSCLVYFGCFLDWYAITWWAGTFLSLPASFVHWDLRIAHATGTRVLLNYVELFSLWMTHPKFGKPANSLA